MEKETPDPGTKRNGRGTNLCVNEQELCDKDVCTWDFDHRAGVEVGEEVQVGGGRPQDHSEEIVVM